MPDPGAAPPADAGRVSRPAKTLLLTLLAVLALSAPAGALVRVDCPGTTSQPFLDWLDPLHYVLADGGDIDASAPGWTLRGAADSLPNPSAPSLAQTGEPFVLGLGTGASATSPPTCVALLAPVMRFMVRSTGSPLGVLAVSAVVDGTTLPLGVVTGLGRNVWRPSLPMVLSTSLLPNLGNAEAEVRFRFTPAGLGARFEVDDIYVDPYRKR